MNHAPEANIPNSAVTHQYQPAIEHHIALGSVPNTAITGTSAIGGLSAALRSAPQTAVVHSIGLLVDSRLYWERFRALVGVWIQPGL